jgi:hypothetical protein
MDHKETLKGMLQDIINGKDEQAAAAMHDYFVAKTREVAGLGGSADAGMDLDELTQGGDGEAE